MHTQSEGLNSERNSSMVMEKPNVILRFFLSKWGLILIGI